MRTRISLLLLAFGTEAAYTAIKTVPAKVSVVGVDTHGLHIATLVQSGCDGVYGTSIVTDCITTACLDENCSEQEALCPMNITDASVTLVQSTFEFDCVEFGNNKYDWAIGCGTLDGERACQAWRAGEGLNDGKASISEILTCDAMQTTFCGTEANCTLDCDQDDVCSQLGGIGFFTGKKNAYELDYFTETYSGEVTIVPEMALDIDRGLLSNWAGGTHISECTMARLFDKCVPKTSGYQYQYGAFLQCMIGVLDDLYLSGKLDGRDRDRIIVMAATSTIGLAPNTPAKSTKKTKKTNKKKKEKKEKKKKKKMMMMKRRNVRRRLAID